MPGPGASASPRTIRLLVTRDAATAEEWHATLTSAGIEAQVEIDDAQDALPGERPLTVLGWAPQEFVYPLRIAADDRDRAIAALIDAGWDGRSGLVQRPPTPGASLVMVALAAAGIVGVFALARIISG